LNTYECIRTISGHKHEIRGLEKISDDRIVSCSQEKTIRIWDLNSGECLKLLRGHENFVLSIVVFTDDKIMMKSKY
jgi:WD40 repeat protein